MSSPTVTERVIKVIETNNNGHSTFDAALLSKSTGVSSVHTAEGVIAEMNNKGTAPTDVLLESRQIQTLENEEKQKQIQNAANANRLARIEENAKIHYGQLRNNAVEARAEMQAIRNTLNKSTNTAERDLLQEQLKAAQIKYTNAQQKFSTKKARIKERQNAENARIQERQKAENARIQERQKAANANRITRMRDNASITDIEQLRNAAEKARYQMYDARRIYRDAISNTKEGVVGKNEMVVAGKKLEAAQIKYTDAKQKLATLNAMIEKADASKEPIRNPNTIKATKLPNNPIVTGRMESLDGGRRRTKRRNGHTHQ